VQGRRAGVKAVLMRQYCGVGIRTFRVNISYEFSLDVSSPISSDEKVNGSEWTMHANHEDTLTRIS
jgi:hypothetical protein